MTARVHTDPCGGITAIESTHMTLTNDPRNFTEISSLFQTFVQQDVSSGEDEDSEVMAETHCADDYNGRGAATTASSRDVGAYSSGYAHRSDHFARASSSLLSRPGQGSPNSTYSRNPFNRSSHNPYALLSSSDVNRPEQEASVMENSRVAPRQRSSYSYSNNTSQNALMFEFNSTSTSTSSPTPADFGSCNLTDSGISRRHPSQQLQHQQPVDAPSTGFWRDGNRMTFSATDIRPISVTTVGTLTCSDKEQKLNVNVKQRLRPGTNSASCSLNASSMTIPVVQSGSPTPASASAMARNVPSVAEAALPAALGATYKASRFSTGGVLASEEHTSPGPSSQQLDRRCIDGGANIPSTADGVELPSQRRKEHEVFPYISCEYHSKSVHYHIPQQQQQHPKQQQQQHPQQQQQQHPQQQQQQHPQQQQQHHPQQQQQHHPQQQQQQHPQQQQQQHPQQQQQQHPQQQQQQHPQQQQYGYGIQAQPCPMQQHPQAAYVYGGYPSHHYPAMPPQPGCYTPITITPKRQQYYAPPTPSSSISIIRSAADSAPIQTYTEMAYAPVPQPPQTPYMASAGTIMGPYSYLPMSPVTHYAAVALSSFSEMQGVMQQKSSGSVTAEAQHIQAVKVGTGDSTPVTAAGAVGKPTKAKSQHVDPLPSHYQGAKNIVIPAPASSSASTPSKASKTGTQSASTVARTSVAPRMTSVSSKMLPKRQDDARFHVNHDAPIRLFVVVKRKREGQRYACPLSPEEVPVGSYMLVEGDRGADIGEVIRHVSIEKMARDCAIVERLRQRAVERMQGSKEGILSDAYDAASNADLNEANLPQLTGESALEYVMSLKTWPWLIGPTTAEDIASLGPQLEAERQAYATAKPIVQQFIENRYLQRFARNEAALAAAAATAEVSKTADTAAPVDEESGDYNADHASTDEGDRRRHLTPLSAEELKMLELSREVTLVDCEYQFTREKITLYVSRPSRNMFVDFRSMQRKLFRTFRCRIWIAYMDEVTHDKDAPESFVFVPSSSASASATVGAPTRDDVKGKKDCALKKV